MNFKEAWDIIGGLSKPSKMPWWSYSIPAKACKTGSVLAQKEGTVCYNCYALKGFYNMPVVQAALDRRLKAMDDPRFVDAFVVVLTDLWARSKSGENRFRWFDSGDIQSEEHLTKINTIANLTPFVRHWLPTKEAGIIGSWLKKNEQALNLTIRQSNPMVGSAFKASHKLPFSTVGVKRKSIHQCPAPTQSNKCLSCDKCWNSKVKGVNYHEH